MSHTFAIVWWWGGGGGGNPKQLASLCMLLHVIHAAKEGKTWEMAALFPLRPSVRMAQTSVCYRARFMRN